jgi:hypothetical protein
LPLSDREIVEITATYYFMVLHWVRGIRYLGVELVYQGLDALENGLEDLLF